MAQKMFSKAIPAALMLLAAAGSAQAAINGVFYKDRLFNDYPDSNLTVVRNFPTQIKYTETNFGSGGFANRHSAYFSEDGGTSPKDFNYGDAFDVCTTLDLDATPAGGREGGFHIDQFGLGIFGVLPNGEIANFGSVLPFYSAGIVWTPGAPVSLRMTYRPGNGDGVNPSTIPSTIEYQYDVGAGFVSSGQIAFSNLEGGIVSSFDFFLGLGVQNQGAPGGTSIADFTNIKIPAPAGMAVLGLAGMFASRRRRA